MRSLAGNEGIANKSMISGSPRYSAVSIVMDRRGSGEDNRDGWAAGKKALMREARKEETEAV